MNDIQNDCADWGSHTKKEYMLKFFIDIKFYKMQIYLQWQHINGCWKLGGAVLWKWDKRGLIAKRCEETCGWWIHSLFWSWWWFHRCLHMWHFTKLYTLNICSLSYNNHIPTKIGKREENERNKWRQKRYIFG